MAQGEPPAVGDEGQQLAAQAVAQPVDGQAGRQAGGEGGQGSAAVEAAPVDSGYLDFGQGGGGRKNHPR